MTEKKTTWPFHRNQDWKGLKIEIEKVNKLSTNISTDNITKLKELIYAGVKLIFDKISIPLENRNKNTKRRWEIELEELIKKLRQQAKVPRKEQRERIY